MVVRFAIDLGKIVLNKFLQRGEVQVRELSDRRFI